MRQIVFNFYGVIRINNKIAWTLFQLVTTDFVQEPVKLLNYLTTLSLFLQKLRSLEKNMKNGSNYPLNIHTKFIRNTKKFINIIDFPIKMSHFL